MLKQKVKQIARSMGYLIVDNSTIGVDFENDLKRLTSNNPILKIFDVGGNYGQSAVRFAQAFPEAEIYTFEPVPQLFNSLCGLTSKYSKIREFNLGFGDQKTTAIMGLADNPGANSLLIADQSDRTCEVEIHKLDDFVAENSVKCIDLLKIDVEGYEIPVIEGALETFKRGIIRYIYAECVFSSDPDEPHTRFHDLHRLLDTHGYSFICCYTESFKLASGCSMGNVLYGNKNRLPTSALGRFGNIV